MEPTIDNQDIINAPKLGFRWGKAKLLLLLLTSYVVTACGGISDSSTNFVEGNESDNTPILTEDSPWFEIGAAYIKTAQDPRAFHIMNGEGGAMLVQQMITENGTQARIVAIDCDGDPNTDEDKINITGILIPEETYYNESQRQESPPDEFCK